MEFVPSPSVDAAAPSLEGCTLVVACAAHATTGQCAADLLIHTLRLRRVGILLTPHLVPCCGNEAEGALTTALEVWGGAGVAVVQQRSPAVAGSQTALASELAAWAERAGVAKLVALAGVDPRAVSHVGALAVGAAPFRCHASPAWTTPLPSGWQPLETDTVGGVPLAASRTPPWPLVEACKRRGVPAVALLLFGSDSAALATECSALLPCGPTAAWQPPASWAFARGGPTHEDAIAMY